MWEHRGRSSAGFSLNKWVCRWCDATDAKIKKLLEYKYLRMKRAIHVEDSDKDVKTAFGDKGTRWGRCDVNKNTWSL